MQSFLLAKAFIAFDQTNLEAPADLVVAPVLPPKEQWEPTLPRSAPHWPAPPLGPFCRCANPVARLRRNSITFKAAPLLPLE